MRGPHSSRPTRLKLRCATPFEEAIGLDPRFLTKPALAVAAVCIGACGRIGYDELAIETSTGFAGAFSSGGGVPSGGPGTTSSGAAAGIGGGASSSAGGADGSGGTGATGGAGSTGTTGGASGSADAGLDSGEPVAGQMYQIIGQSSGKCLDVPKSSTSDGTTLDILGCTGGSNQLFRFNALLAGASTIVNVNSGKCLQVADPMTSVRVSQAACSGAITQTFSLMRSTGSYFRVVSGSSGNCVEVAGDVKTDGAHVHQYNCNAQPNQNWTLTPVGTAACTPESDMSFCATHGSACGTASGVDTCGSARTAANCGPCVALTQACGLTMPNTCSAIGKTSVTQGGTATSSSLTSTPADAFDGNASTEWFANTATAGWLAYQFAGTTRIAVTSYAVTSGRDWSDRDPTAWQLEGSNDGTRWTLLDTRTGQSFANRTETKYYTFPNATSYNGYRLNVTANNGSNDLQIAELQLFQ